MNRFDDMPWFQQYLAMMEEVKRHKYIESEKAGRDVGIEWAIVDWDIKHRSLWTKEWKKAHPTSERIPPEPDRSSD